MRGVLLIGLALSFGLAPLAAAPVNRDAITELYRRGLAGDKIAVEECIEKLEEVVKVQPSNQLARVYLGSAYTLRSRDLGFGPKKLQALKHGLALMDEAVRSAPNDPKVRLVRALTTSALPSLFRRAASSRDDFVALAGMADRTPDKFEGGDLQIIYYHAGRAAKHAGDPSRARAYWEAALRHPVDAKITAKTEAEIAKTR